MESADWVELQTYVAQNDKSRFVSTTKYYESAYSFRQREKLDGAFVYEIDIRQLKASM